MVLANSALAPNTESPSFDFWYCYTKYDGLLNNLTGSFSFVAPVATRFRLIGVRLLPGKLSKQLHLLLSKSLYCSYLVFFLFWERCSCQLYYYCELTANVVTVSNGASYTIKVDHWWVVTMNYLLRRVVLQWNRTIGGNRELPVKKGSVKRNFIFLSVTSAWGEC